jgi:acetyltransferase-like isoleucine patch superfamily enzyme
MLKHASFEGVKVRITPALDALFDHHRLYSGQHGKKRWKVGEVLSVSRDARIEAYSHILGGNVVPAALGAFSYCVSRLEPTMRIGRYCSIAGGVGQIPGGHPTDWVSSSPFSHHPHPLHGFADYLKDRGVSRYRLHPFDLGSAPIEIGNDVWIGDSAVLKPGITIGDGAIVAMRAMVSRDVPPYAIVGGLPAKLIRHRFPEELAERIRQTEWWRFGPDVLQALDVRKPENFVERFEEAVANGAEPLELPVLTGEEIIATGELVS